LYSHPAQPFRSRLNLIKIKSGIQIEELDMPIPTGYEHIFINDNKVPIIAGTNMKVIELVLEHIAFGWSPEELHLNHPYLSLGQIHSALDYYWDHKDELDADIERRCQYTEQLRRSAPASSLKARLKAKGLI
jgi:uncharacterized protein (DUF433 family)